MPKSLWHRQWHVFKCKERAFTIRQTDSGDEELVWWMMSIFSHAWNQLTEGRIHTFVTFAHIFCASVLRDFQQRQFMVTWNGAQASSFHSHGSSFLWLCLSFFPVFHLYWASTFSQTRGGNCASENVSIHFVAKYSRLSNSGSTVATLYRADCVCLCTTL